MKTPVRCMDCELDSHLFWTKRSHTRWIRHVHVDHADVILGALELYARTGLGYVDCLMLSGFREEGNDFVSFDKKLMKMKQRL